LHRRVASLSGSDEADGADEVHDGPLLSLQVGVTPRTLSGMWNAVYSNGRRGCHKIT